MCCLFDRLPDLRRAAFVAPPCLSGPSAVRACQLNVVARRLERLAVAWPRRRLGRWQGRAAHWGAVSIFGWRWRQCWRRNVWGWGGALPPGNPGLRLRAGIRSGMVTRAASGRWFASLEVDQRLGGGCASGQQRFVIGDRR